MSRLGDIRYQQYTHGQDRPKYQTASELIVKWYVMNFAEGVDKCFYYYMREDGIGLFEYRNKYQAIIEYDRKPMAHGVALAILTRFLGSSYTFSQQDVRHYVNGDLVWIKFEKPKTPLVISWWEKSQDGSTTRAIKVPDNVDKVFNLMGNVVLDNSTDHKKQLTISSEPFYFTFRESEKRHRLN